MAVTGELEYAPSIDQLGRVLGFFNGCGQGVDTVDAFFANYGGAWKTAAVTVYPVLQKLIGDDRKPDIEALERGIAALFKEAKPNDARKGGTEAVV